MNFTWKLVTWPNGKQLRLGIEGDTIRIVMTEGLTQNQRTILLGRSASEMLSEWRQYGNAKVEEVGSPWQT